jgi:hypothetical protein
MDGSNEMLADKVNKYSFLIFYLLSLVFSLFLLTGCAEKVSSKDVAGSTIRVQVDLGSDPSLENYKYVFVYSKKQISINIDEYIFLPGQDFDFDHIDFNKTKTTAEENSSKNLFINYYYKNYFSSWCDYIYFTNVGAIENQDLYDSGAVTFPVTANQITNQEFVKRNLNSDVSFSFMKVSGDYDLEFQIEFQTFGVSKPNPADDFFFNFFTINSDNILVNCYGGDNNTLKNLKSDYKRVEQGAGSTYNDVKAIKVTVI